MDVLPEIEAALAMFRKLDMDPELRAALDERSVAIYYEPRFRDYTIFSAEPGEAPRVSAQESGPWGFAGGFVIHYGPWTGKALPFSLENEWWDLAISNHGFDQREHDNLSPIDDLPKEMQGEEWWVKRIGEGPAFEAVWEPVDDQQEEVPSEEPYNAFCDPKLPGQSRESVRPPHMCWDSELIFRGPRCMYWYVPKIREYGIRIIEVEQPVDHQPIHIKPVLFCPWCGTELPKSLRGEWEDRLKNLGLSPQSTNLPAELTTDTWWRRE